jgi:hypothetical protein
MIRDFIVLKFHHGQNIEKDSDTGTLAEFFRINEPTLPQELSKRCPGTYKPKAPFIWLEGTIMSREVSKLINSWIIQLLILFSLFF